MFLKSSADVDKTHRSYKVFFSIAKLFKGSFTNMKFLAISAILLLLSWQCESQTTAGTGNSTITNATGGMTIPAASGMTTPGAGVTTTPVAGVATSPGAGVMTTAAGGVTAVTGQPVTSSGVGTTDTSNVTSGTSAVTGKDVSTVAPTVCTKVCMDPQDKPCVESDANCTCNETCSEVGKPSPQSGGLSGGEIAGVAVGAVAGVVLIGAVAAALVTCKKKKGRSVSPNSRTAMVEEGSNGEQQVDG
ncbi:cell wall integrity and stress response component 2-like isoform X2 [Branchiostoma floridae]|uniref:Cell wall integrity and stress response component 2-like isoform X2 n=1 Tax=Branchiostoma floridae TaxID=7739 RepID=A0A9J7KQM4_BRAFL|nr:cell wall integrity and stress response component 2-like isoform X2 [Branchiostoma floridae]